MLLAPGVRGVDIGKDRRRPRYPEAQALSLTASTDTGPQSLTDDADPPSPGDADDSPEEGDQQ